LLDSLLQEIYKDLSTMAALLSVSEKHIRFLNDTFRNPSAQSFCQDVEIRCSNGSLLFNKLLVGLVFPELRDSFEYQLPMDQVLLLPQFSLQEVFLKFTKYFVDLDVKEESNERVQSVENTEGGNYESDCGETYEEIITELVVEDGEEGEHQTVEDCIIETGDSETVASAEKSERFMKCKCNICGEEFMHKSSLCRHMKQKHVDRLGKENKTSRAKSIENKSNKCETCGKIFKFRTHLINHQNTHTKPFKCGLCSENFADDSKLASHELNVHGELINGFGVSNSLMKCSYCPKVFPAKSQLVLHERTHTKEKPFQCSQCHKKFSAKCNLTAHERIHFGESKRYECRHPPCTRKFSHTSERKDHETIHTGEKPYMCPHCGETYRRNANLWRHKKKCMGVEKFEEIDSKMIVEEDTDFIVQDPENNCTTKYEIVFVDSGDRKSIADAHKNVVSEQVVVAS